MLSELAGEVAILDLINRQVERTFPLDLGKLRDSPLSVAFAQLSHDGRSLYVFPELPDDWRRSPNSQPPESEPVWVVDLTAWQVTHHVDVRGDLRSLYVDPDGDRLHVLSQVRNPADSGLWRFQLNSFDTNTFEILNMIELSDMVDGNARFWLTSTTETYRDTYGYTPMIDGIGPADVEEYTTLPQVRLVVEDEQAPVGITTPIELEFLHPATGEPLSSPDPSVRFDPGQPVTLFFEQPGAKSLISVSAELSPGHRGGTVKLKAAGLWDAQIIVGDDLSGFTLVLPDALFGTPTLAGSNDRMYDLRLETESEEPVPAGEVLIRAQFVDALTGEPMAADVSLIGGMPETMRISLVGAGAISRNLEPVEHGIYEATITFETPAIWSASLTFQQPESSNGSAVQIEMGSIDVFRGAPAP